MLTPIVASAIKDNNPGEVLAEWVSSGDEANMEQQFSEKVDSTSALDALKQMEARLSAMSDAMSAQAEEVASLCARPAPPTRTDVFDTPAVSAPRYTTIPSSTIPPFDPMRQLASTPAVAVPDRGEVLARASDEKVKKAAALTGVAYVGKAITAFENKKLIILACAESTRQCAEDTLCTGVEAYIASGAGGHSLPVLACLLAYRMREPIRGGLVRRWSTFSSTAILLITCSGLLPRHS